MRLLCQAPVALADDALLHSVYEIDDRPYALLYLGKDVAFTGLTGCPPHLRVPTPCGLNVELKSWLQRPFEYGWLVDGFVRQSKLVPPRDTLRNLVAEAAAGGGLPKRRASDEAVAEMERVRAMHEELSLDFALGFDIPTVRRCCYGHPVDVASELRRLQAHSNARPAITCAEPTCTQIYPLPLVRISRELTDTERKLLDTLLK